MINEDLFKITSKKLVAEYALIGQKADLLSIAASHVKETTRYEASPALEARRAYGTN